MVKHLSKYITAGFLKLFAKKLHLCNIFDKNTSSLMGLGVFWLLHLKVLATYISQDLLTPLYWALLFSTDT